MTTTQDPAKSSPTRGAAASDPLGDSPQPPARQPRPSSSGWFPQLLLRLHFYAGLFVGPFILVAALSGAIYAAAPSIEKVVYQHELTAPVSATSVPLADQVTKAESWITTHHPGDTVIGVKPAPAAGATTQVLFAERGATDDQNRAVFVDPGTGAVRGDLLAYGTVLPIGTWADILHRTLFLGNLGKTYIELAASWLGIISLAGLGLWIVRIRKARAKKELILPNSALKGRRRMLSWHASTGVWLLLGALFLSATGITWSQFAGNNVSNLRSALSWQSPELNTAVAHGDGATGAQPDTGSGASAGSASGTADTTAAVVDPAMFDAILAKARSVNIHSSQVEIDVPTTAGDAWVVSEIKRSYPTAVNTVAIDGATMAVVGSTDFADYSIPAKLARWGIDTHMGLMWGLPNQILLFVTALGIAAMVVFGYVMWWQRRPTRGTRPTGGTRPTSGSRPATASRPARMGKAPAAGALARAPWWGIAIAVGVSLVVGAFLPEFGLTLLGFVLVDTILTARKRVASA